MPHRESPAASRSRRSVSHAHTSAAARWNCWAVSSRSVYRISTATPRVPSRSASPEPITPCRRRIANVYAASPRYASVLPPPVGKNSNCTSASEGSANPRRASACDGSVSPGRHSSTNASWNGRHDLFSGTSFSRSKAVTSDEGDASRARTTSLRTRCCAIAWFANRKASRAIPLVRSSSTARSSRSATACARSSACDPAGAYRATSGSDSTRVACDVSHRRYP